MQQECHRLKGDTEELVEHVGSVVSPSWQDIGELGAIAVIRTFLNYFLEKDLDSAEARERSPEKGNEVIAQS